MTSAPRAFFTIVACNYLAYALVLGDSVMKFHPEAEFNIVLIDDIEGIYKNDITGRGFKAIYPEDLPIKNFMQLVFQYNITEASTAIKAHVFELLYTRGFDQVIYLDPDILCLRRLDDVLDGLNTHAIVITPHSLSPVHDDTFPTDMMHMFTGVYNLGFIATKSSEITAEFLEWWRKHLEAMCINAPEMGIFVDQKWIDLAPAFFPKVLILRNPSYNVAYWNLHERHVARDANGTWRVDPSGLPIAFYHFSGVSIRNPNGLTKHGTRSPFNSRFGVVRQNLGAQADLQKLVQHYLELIRAAGAERYMVIPYGYKAYSNGELISQLERALFFSVKSLYLEDSNPFLAGEHTFWRACRKSGIRASKASIGDLTTQDLNSRYKVVFALFQLGLKVAVRIMGPELYAKFAKYVREQLILTNQSFLLKSKDQYPAPTR